MRVSYDLDFFLCGEMNQRNSFLTTRQLTDRRFQNTRLPYVQGKLASQSLLNFEGAHFCRQRDFEIRFFRMIVQSVDVLNTL